MTILSVFHNSANLSAETMIFTPRDKIFFVLGILTSGPRESRTTIRAKFEFSPEMLVRLKGVDKVCSRLTKSKL